MPYQVFAFGGSKGGPVVSGGDSAPEWVEISGLSDTTNDTATTAVTLSGGIPSGNMSVVLIGTFSSTATVSGVTDTGGNTYSLDESRIFNGNHKLWVYSAPITTSLSISNTVTVAWGTPNYSNRVIAINNLAGVTSKNVSAANDTYSTSITIPGTTTVSKAVCIGVINTSDETYSSSNWTIESIMTQGSVNVYPVHTDEITSGSKDPGGAISTIDSWGGIWVAYE